MPRKPTAKTTYEDDRTRNWVFVLYPESAPKDWINQLNDMHIAFIVSPLHDRDEEPGTGGKEFKKAHYHVILKFTSKKSYEQICSITHQLNCPIPQRVHDLQTMVRYLCHLDHPHKFQYSTSDIKAYGGIDIEEYLKPLSAMRHMYIRQMIDFVEENDITEFHDLMLYARRYRNDDWLILLMDNCSNLMNMFIKSRRHGKKTIIVSSDGEVVDEVPSDEQ